MSAIFRCLLTVAVPDRFNISRLVQSLIMVQAVEEVNKRKELGNLTLGYWIMDSCSDVTTALMNSQVFMKKSSKLSNIMIYLFLL